MRLLVAGAQGQLGQALAERGAQSADMEVLVVGRPRLDLVDSASIARVVGDFRPDVVINAAAYTAVDKAESEPDAAFALNADGAGRLADATARAGAAIVHVSTDYVFDGRKPQAYVEGDATGPTSVYGRSKLAGEAAVMAGNARHLVVRTAWVHSAVGANFVRTMLRLASERPTLRVVDDQKGSPTYAPHLADALLELAQRAAATPVGDGLWGIYHAAGAGETTWCGLAREVMNVSRALGGPTAEVVAITTADYPTPARRPANSRLDCGKLAGVIGRGLPDWETGVSECVARLVRV